MKQLYFEKLRTVIRLNFLNFDKRPSVCFLSPADRTGEVGLEINLFKDKHGSIIKRLRKSGLRDHVKKTAGGSYCELFDIERRRTFCLFENGIFLNFLIDHGVNRSFLAFQTVLDVMFLHAASVLVKDRLFLFIAPSGGGKTTISSLARERGLRVLNDEFCAIKRVKNRFYAGMFPCFTPFVSPCEEWEVSSIFFLNKSETNRVSDISAAEAIRRALPEAMRFYRNHVPRDGEADYRRHVFNFLGSLFDNTEFGSLYFKKHPDIFLCLN